MKVLIVDDSVVYRKTISETISGIPGVDVLGEANHGRIALAKLKQNKADLMILDMEMPEMDGLETIKAIKDLDSAPKVLIFAAQTAQGAKKAFKALEAGAMEIIPKPAQGFTSIEKAKEHVEDILVPKIREIQRSFRIDSALISLSGNRSTPGNTPVRTTTHQVQSPSGNYNKINLDSFDPGILLVGSSTGGPMALETLVSSLKGKLDLPLIFVQHMPPVFTASLAARLAKLCGVDIREVRNGERVVPGQAYIAPGDFHVEVKLMDRLPHLFLNQGPKVQSVRPAVDVTFKSAATVYGKRCMAFVLTGMGADGADGCDAIKKAGGGVMIQDEESCVVWGMPKAVHDRGAYDSMGSIDDCMNRFTRFAHSKR